MKHLTEEELTLHYYQKSSTAAEHMAECAECSGQYEELASLLAQVKEVEIPERPAGYASEVWRRVRAQIPERQERRSWWATPRSWVMAGALAAVAVVAFLAGRVSQDASHERPPAVAADLQRERVLQMAVNEHLERTQRMLLEMKHAPAGSAAVEQRTARDLVDANRLYRQTAKQIGDEALVSTLEDLERFLINVAHAEGEDDWERQTLRTESEDLLFKIRIIRSNLNRELANPERPDTEAVATPRVTI